MHIPDGYLSPATAAAAYAVAAPFWYHASTRVKETLRSQSAPMVALFAAFSFTIQMFNIPIPGGTTAHAVGGTLMAVVLGPWTAVVGVSTALIIQALFFGDGGITAIGANCLNMAIALPLTGFAVYRLLAGRSPSSGRRIAAAAVGSYVGINVAALLAGLELGIQPLFWSDGGKALYSPYGLQVTVPAMMVVHLTLVGFAEAAFTALAVAYLLRTQPALMQEGDATEARRLGKGGWSVVGVLAAMVVLTPIGLLAPGGADFEWGAGELRTMIGYVPAGLAQLGESWGMAPLRAYQLPGTGAESSFFQQAPGYILSAIVGVGLIFTLVFAARIALSRRTSATKS
jgi:cobalt/nickel transport system permease protein